MAKTPKTDDVARPEESEDRPTGEGQKTPSVEDSAPPEEAGDTGAADAPADNPVPGDSSPDDMPVEREAPETAASAAPEAPAATEIDNPPPPPPVAATPPRRGMSVLLGGVLAALLGAGALYYASTQDWVRLGGPDEDLLARIDALESGLAAADTALDEAQSEIAALKAAEPDLSGVTSAIDAAQEAARSAATANAEAIAALTERLNATDGRVQTLAVEKIPEAALPQAISDAYDAKLADLLATIDGRFAAMRTGLDEKIAEMEAEQAATAEAEAAALAAARLAEARAAFATIRTALQNGTPFAVEIATISDLTDATVPAALSDPAESGVPTVDALADSFPAAARDALKVSAADAVEDGTLTRFEAFLRTQAGARSLTPQDGDDPDAVLSRAEAAVARGDMVSAITELQALPEAGQAAMAGWLARAETRRDALAAATELAAQLEQD